MTTNQIREKERYRSTTFDQMKGYVRKYLQLDNYNSDGEGKSEKSKRSLTKKTDDDTDADTPLRQTSLMMAKLKLQEKI